MMGEKLSVGEKGFERGGKCDSVEMLVLLDFEQVCCPHSL